MDKQFKWREALVLRRSIKKKLKDFHKAGYLNVVETEVWDYLTDRIWKNVTIKSVTERKKDIENITTNDFFDYQQIKAQVKSVETFDFGDIQDLL